MCRIEAKLLPKNTSNTHPIFTPQILRSEPDRKKETYEHLQGFQSEKYFLKICPRFCQRSVL